MKTTKSLAQRVAEILKQRGVQRIFGVPGGGSSLDLIEAAAEQDIDFVLCRTETGAAIMAAVTGELTGIPGIVLTGIGPGAASAVNGITYASLERAPIIIFTDAHEVNATEPPHQIFDQQSFVRADIKGTASTDAVEWRNIFERLIDLAAALNHQVQSISTSLRRMLAPTVPDRHTMRCRQRQTQIPK